MLNASNAHYPIHQGHAAFPATGKDCSIGWPRMQVKCLRVLQYFPPPEDPSISRALNSTLKRIITGSDVAKNINKNNAQHAIVFEAIGLALALDADPDLLNAGGRFIHLLVFKLAAEDACITLLLKFTWLKWRITFKASSH